MLKRHNHLMLLFFRVVDIMTGMVAWVLAHLLLGLAHRFGWRSYSLPPLADFLPAMAIAAVLTPLMFSRAHLYQPKRTANLIGELLVLFRTVFLIWALTLIVIAFMKHMAVSRALMLVVLVTWVMLAALNRLVVRSLLRWFRQRGWNTRSAAIVGTGRTAQKLHQTIERNAWTGILPEYFIGDSPSQRRLRGLEVLGPYEAAEDILLSRPVDIAFVALSGKEREQTDMVLGQLSRATADIRVVPDLLSSYYLKYDVSQLDDLAIVSLTYSPQHGWNSLLKRLIDVSVSALAILVLAVPMLIIALAIKLTSRGAVFYRQERMSLGGKRFMMIKFRTMVTNAEDDSGAVWATPDDPRVTRVGRILRRISLDELPQLFNVLSGQMSLVGPRPERPELIEKFRKQVPHYMLRSQVKAGMTGWAQIHGLRGQTSLRKRIQYDLNYLTKWSLGLDLRIMLMTPFRGLINPNAY